MATKKFKTEVTDLLQLIIHSLYSNREIFLRELISNASDAIDKLKYLSLIDGDLKGYEFNPRIDLSFTEDGKRTLTIKDNGIGMDEDDLNNNLSAAIIKSHVKLGVEKGREIGLPQEVLDIISQHHGNDIITYFFNEAKKNNPDGARLVHEEDFRYNSDIPQTPEAAIVMLADCTEAASRTLKNPNTQKYDRLIMSIIISKINHNQLSASKLTLTDLVKIKDTFIRSLIGRDHQRIEYDKD